MRNENTLPLQCLLIDDEPLATKLLTDYVAKTPGLELAASFNNPIAAIQYFQASSVDLIFLDVQMPELSGIQLAKIIGDQCPVILTTAYEEYALEGYELNVTDYLLKPISLARFQKAVAKVGSNNSGLTNTADQNVDFIFIKNGQRTQRIDLADLLYLSSSGDYVTLYLVGDGKVLTLENLSSFAARLPPNRFCRIHRSHMVAIDKIEFIERQRVIIGGQWLPISKGYQEDFWGRIKGQ